MNNASNETLHPTTELPQESGPQQASGLAQKSVQSAADESAAPETAPETDDENKSLMHFLSDASEKENNDVLAEDPFFSPLPEIDVSDDEEEVSSDAGWEEIPPETTYVSEQSLKASDTGDAAETDVPQNPDEAPSGSPDGEPESGRKIGKILGITAGGIAGCILLVFGILCAILFRLSGPVTVNLDGTVSLGTLETHPILSRLTDAQPAPAEVDTSSIGERQIRLTFFGFLPRTVTVSVCDLTAPAIAAYRMTLGVGTVPEPADCVMSCEDKTAVTHVFKAVPDTSVPGERTCTLLSTDEGGNVTETAVLLTVLADACTQKAEFGTDETAVTDLFAAAYPDYPTFDLTAVDYSACGTYRVTAESADERTILSLVLADTTPPRGTAHNFNLLSGNTLTPEDFVTDLKDASAVTLSYRTAPDFDSLAPQTVVVRAEDAAGNSAEFPCALQIWNISGELTAECGTTLDELRDALLELDSSASTSVSYTDSSFTDSNVREWFMDPARQENDIEVLTSADGKSSYIVIYRETMLSWERTAKTNYVNDQLEKQIDEWAKDYSINAKVLAKLGKLETTSETTEETTTAA